jgi:hypothetical protein
MTLDDFFAGHDNSRHIFESDLRKRLLWCTGSPPMPPSGLRLSWNAAETDKYRPLLLKLSHISRLRRTAAGWASALLQRGGSPEFQTVPSFPNNGLVQGGIVWRLPIFSSAVLLHLLSVFNSGLYAYSAPHKSLVVSRLVGMPSLMRDKNGFDR